MRAFLRESHPGSNHAVWDCVFDYGGRIAVAVVEAETPTNVFIRNMTVPSKDYAEIMHQRLAEFFCTEGFKTISYMDGTKLVYQDI